MKLIKVEISGRDLTDPVVECPFRDGEYMSCQIHRGLKCPEDIEDVADLMYLYDIPRECPLRKGPVKVIGE